MNTTLWEIPGFKEVKVLGFRYVILGRSLFNPLSKLSQLYSNLSLLIIDLYFENTSFEFEYAGLHKIRAGVANHIFPNVFLQEGVGDR